MKSIVILISGRGSNMQALVEAQLPANIAAVISNRADAKGLDYARDKGIPTLVVAHRDYATREAFDAALMAAIDRFNPSLLVLAGFMRVLTPRFVEHYAGRMVNIHPSLLPALPGLHTHRRALAAGSGQHGCTVHFVTPEVDTGPIIAQAPVPVLPDDDEDTLAARVLEQEHLLYPHALRLLLEDRAVLRDGVVLIDGTACKPQLRVSE
jgi:phosphoribosylglycinamide formyltransferase 1